MKYTSLLMVLLFGFAMSARAEEAKTEDTQGQTKAKLEQVKKDSGAKQEDIDQEITNARMRAETGSKKKLSMQFALSYVGGNFKQPFGRKKPALLAGDTASATSLGGGISARYRINKSDSVGANIGVAWSSPFQDKPWKNRPGKDTKAGEISNPGIDYGKAFAWGKLQNSVGASVSYYTSRYYADDQHYFMSYGASWNSLMNPWTIPLTLGLAVDGSIQTFKNDEVDGQEKSGFGVYPYLEYAFNDKVNFRTVFRPWVYSHMRSEPTSAFIRSPYTQSVGLGVSLSRDVYFYPNFQFQPQSFNKGMVKAEATNVGVSTIINL